MIHMNISEKEAKGYDSLRESEQLEKLRVVSDCAKPDDKILDVGCGTGLSTHFFGRNCSGIDPSQQMVSEAKRKYPDIEFKQAPAEKIPYADDTFDLVVSISAAHLFENPGAALREIIRVGKLRFVISFPDRSSKSDTLHDLIGKYFVIDRIIRSRIDRIYFLKCKEHQCQT